MGPMTPTTASSATTVRPSWGLRLAGIGFAFSAAAVVSVGILSNTITETNLNTVPTGLQANTVYSDCSPLPQADGQTSVLVECESPSLTQISLSGTAASSVLSDPQASWSVPVEAKVEDPEKGTLYFEIGSPYRTER